jgi:hypothetical protein
MDRNEQVKSSSSLWTLSGLTANQRSSSIFARASDGEETTFTTDSSLIQSVLISALLTGSAVEIETEADSKAIKRVHPFQNRRDTFTSVGKFGVSRLATQKTSSGHHLEAFVQKSGDTFDKAYNIYEPHLQQLLAAVFGWTPDTLLTSWFRTMK